MLSGLGNMHNNKKKLKKIIKISSGHQPRHFDILHDHILLNLIFIEILIILILIIEIKF